MQSWAIERVRDTEKFLRELDRPLDGSPRKPTPEEVATEGAGFMAFAAAFGVQPPSPAPAAV